MSSVERTRVSSRSRTSVGLPSNGGKPKDPQPDDAGATSPSALSEFGAGAYVSSCPRLRLQQQNIARRQLKERCSCWGAGSTSAKSCARTKVERLDFALLTTMILFQRSLQILHFIQADMQICWRDACVTDLHRD